MGSIKAGQTKFTVHSLLSQERVNHFVLLHVLKDKTDILDLKVLAT